VSIRVHIEQLVIDGCDVHRVNGARVGVVVEAELSKLSATPGAEHEIAAIGAVPSAEVGEPYRRGGSASAVGGEIVRSVHAGTTGEESADTARPK
jgi:hypothetical protein